jgi:putative transposase
MTLERTMEQTRRQRRDENAWGSVISGFEGSGLTVSQFCEREGIGAASFYHWRSRLRQGARRKRRAQADPAVPAPRGDFLDLGTLSSGSSRMEVRLELGGGVVIHVTRG